MLCSLLILLLPPVISLSQDNDSEKNGLARLLAIDGVAKEAEISQAQLEGLDGLWEETREKIRLVIGDFQRALSGDENSDQPTEKIRSNANEAVAKILKEERERLQEILVDEQLKRLQELQIQLIGPRALLTEPVADKLKISKIQSKKIRDIFLSEAKELRKKLQVMRRKKLSKEESADELSKIQKQLGEKVDVILTNKQRREFKKMRGDEFNFLTGKRKNPKSKSTKRQVDEKPRREKPGGQEK